MWRVVNDPLPFAAKKQPRSPPARPTQYPPDEQHVHGKALPLESVQVYAKADDSWPQYLPAKLKAFHAEVR